MPPKLIIEVVGDTDSLSKALKKADRDTQQFGRTVDKTSATATIGFKGLAKAGAAFAGGFVGTQTAIRGFFGVLNAGIDEFNESTKAAAQTAAALKSTGFAANVTANDIQNLSTKIRNYSGIDDEAVQAAENVLLTFKKVRNEVGAGNQIFDRATVAIADMSSRLGIDLKSAALQVGKALQDPNRGLTALRRSGVSFTDAQAKLIKQLFNTGHALEAQKIILRELQTEFGGSARAAGDELGGKLNILKGNLEDFAGTLVQSATPALEKYVDRLNKWITNTENQAKVNAALTDTVNALATATLLATDGVVKLANALDFLRDKRNAIKNFSLKGPSGLDILDKIGITGATTDFANRVGSLFGIGGGGGGGVSKALQDDLRESLRGQGGTGRLFPQTFGTSGSGSAAFQKPFGTLTRAQRNALALAQAASPAQELAALAEQRKILANQIRSAKSTLGRVRGAKFNEVADTLADLYAQDKSAMEQIHSINEAAARDAQTRADKIKGAAKKAADARERIAKTLADARAASLQDLFRLRTGGQGSLSGLTLGNLRDQFRQLNQRNAAQEQANQFRALGLTSTGEAFAPTLGAFKSQLAKVSDSLKGTLLDTSANRNQLAKIRKALNQNWDALTRDTKLKIKELLDALDGGTDAGKVQSKFRHMSPNKLAAQLGLQGDRRAAAILSQVGFGGSVPQRGLAFAGAGGVNFNGPTTIHVAADDTGKLEAQLTKRAQSRPQVRRGAR